MNGHVADRGMEYLNVQQACALVQVSRRTIYNWLKAGKIEVMRTAGGRLRIRRESLWRSATVDQEISA